MTKKSKPAKPNGARPREAKPKRAKAREAEPKGAKPTAKQASDSHDAATGRFLPGNKAWEARSSAGPTPRFADGEALWAACVQYFEWAEANPITIVGAGSDPALTKPRPFTIRGLCLFLDIENSTWINWRSDRPDLAQAQTRAEAVIYTQKFEGAAVGLYNANIIARDLGLADRVAGHDGGALKVQDVTPQRPDDERLMVLLRPFLGPTPGEAIEAARKLTAPDDNEAAEG